ncbi:MAG TPA: hypothetical protein VK943_17435, partial [Arenibaculum sp.]|nr:hypothetical protein [Arenibaculum sp.]
LNSKITSGMQAAATNQRTVESADRPDVLACHLDRLEIKTTKPSCMTNSLQDNGRLLFFRKSFGSRPLAEISNYGLERFA